MDEQQLSSFLVGIRFVRKFSILDKWGEILDNILFKNEYFSNEYFTQVQNPNTPELFVTDNSGGYLRLNSTDLIFSKTFKNPTDDSTRQVKDVDFKKELAFCKESVCKFLAPCIIEKLDMITQRIGVVYSYTVDQQTSEEIARKYFKGQVDKQFEYRFSIRDLAPITQSRKDKSDYINKIYSTSRANETDYVVSFDYQYFFEPAQAVISDKIGRVIEASENALNKEFFTKERD